MTSTTVWKRYTPTGWTAPVVLLEHKAEAEVWVQSFFWFSTSHAYLGRHQCGQFPLGEGRVLVEHLTAWTGTKQSKGKSWSKECNGG